MRLITIGYKRKRKRYGRQILFCFNWTPSREEHKTIFRYFIHFSKDSTSFCSFKLLSWCFLFKMAMKCCRSDFSYQPVALKVLINLQRTYIRRQKMATFQSSLSSTEGEKNINNTLSNR
jgi:hypothetical protein